MNRVRHRPLSIGPLRAFEAVARRLSFSAAAEELFLTQPAISRQIRGLEEELGAALFVRGTRHVDITGVGSTLLRAVAPLLDRLDASVRQIRSSAGREPVSLTTFASLASLWLLPRLHSFQASHPGIDIRIAATDALADPDDPEIDLALRYCRPDEAPAGAVPMFGEVLTPVCSPALVEAGRRGSGPPLACPADLAHHTLLEEEGRQASAEFIGWRRWLGAQGQPGLEPRGWIYLNFTYQQIQAALAGQGVALARLALVGESLDRGELVEPFGAARRGTSPYAYWLARWPGRRERPALAAFERWVLDQAALTRERVDTLQSPAPPDVTTVR
jgi:LysR family transcriptional regulator, glycine cleavage system transcriptional activator